MRFMQLSFGSGMNPWRRGFHSRRNTRAKSSSADSAGRGSYLDKVKGFQGVWKAALTSASLSATGDLLAQSLPLILPDAKKGEVKFDPSRTLRMFGFGMLFYGPFQYYWYSWLAHMMPLSNTVNFLSKVAANQFILAPIVLTTVFSWNLALTGHADALSDKLQRDLVPTMINGWKFWVPAASINFYAVPIQKQVLYMSVCGVLWTAYLSFASANEIATPAKVEVVEPLKKKGKK